MNLTTRLVSCLSVAFITVLSPHSVQCAEQNAKPLQAIEYDFRGAVLGMSLSEFRSLKYPDSTDANLVHLVCTGDTDASLVGLTLSDAEKRENVTKCNYYKNLTVTEMSPGMWMPAGVAVGTSGYVAYDLTYAFISDPHDTIPRLFLISFSTNADAFEHALNGLVEKFGNPSSKKSDTIQNRMGANFAHTVAIWKNSLSTIYAESPYQSVDKMLVTYCENRLCSAVTSTERQIVGSDASKM